MLWVHLRQRQNILKPMLINVRAFNLSLIMRQSPGYGTPRGLTSALWRPLELLCGRNYLPRMRNHLARKAQVSPDLAGSPIFRGTALAGLRLASER